MGADFSFQIWHARIAHFQSVPVKDFSLEGALLKRILLRYVKISFPR